MPRSKRELGGQERALSRWDYKHSPVGWAPDRQPGINHQAYISSQQLNEKLMLLVGLSQRVGCGAWFGGQVPVAVR